MRDLILYVKIYVICFLNNEAGMPDILEHAFQFFILFSRFECKLKHAGYFKPPCEPHKTDWRAAPCWESFARATGMTLEDLRQSKNEDLTESIQYLIDNPPKKQWIYHGKLGWKESIQPQSLNGLLNCIKTVRNNLFHGGKGEIPQCGQITETRRNKKLLAVSCVILLELENYLPRNDE